MNWYLKTNNNDKPHISTWWIENHNGEIVVDEGMQSNEVGGIKDAKLLVSAPKLLKACQNALKDMEKINQQLIKEGKHEYTLMQKELEEVIELAIG